MKIGIDVRSLYIPDMKGIGVYINNLLSKMGQIDTKNDYYLYYDLRQNNCLRKHSFKNFHDKGISISKGDSFYFWEQLRLPIAINKDRLDLFHSPANTAPIIKNCKLIVTIHDTKIFEIKSTNWVNEIYSKKIQFLALKQADLIICPSEFTKKCVISCLKIKEEKIVVIYNAVNSNFKNWDNDSLKSDVQKRLGINKSYILSVGGETPLKNISNLISSFAILKNKMKINEQLVITGIRNEIIYKKHQSEIQKLGLSGEVVILGYVLEDDLIALYNKASLFVYPSLFEGFGLPPLEAMACGAPVAASNATSIPEIVGDAAITFDAQNIEEMAQKMHLILNNEKTLKELRLKGFERIKEFSWEKTSIKTLQAYQSIQ